MKSKEELIQSMRAFMQAVCDVCKETDKDYAFTYPICGDEAHAYMVSSNHHHHAYCDGCGMRVAE